MPLLRLCVRFFHICIFCIIHIHILSLLEHPLIYIYSLSLNTLSFMFYTQPMVLGAVVGIHLLKGEAEAGVDATQKSQDTKKTHFEIHILPHIQVSAAACTITKPEARRSVPNV